MAMKKTYYTVDGEIRGEKATGGQRVHYLTDALGNVTATVNQSGQVVNTYKYKPYGALLQKTGSGSDPSFQWVGSQGYRQTGKKYSDVYVRARHYETLNGRWTSKDPIGFRGGDWNLYRYAVDCPIQLADGSGLFTFDPSCQATDVSNLISKITNVCSTLLSYYPIGNYRPIWDVIEQCVTRCHGGVLGPKQEQCLADWCATGVVSCDYSKNCAGCKACASSPSNQVCACAPCDGPNYRDNYITLLMLRRRSNHVVSSWRPSR